MSIADNDGQLSDGKDRPRVLPTEVKEVAKRYSSLRLRRQRIDLPA